MSEELNLRQAAERLIYWCGRIDRASTEAEENECCNERDKLFAVFRKVDAERVDGKAQRPEGSAQREARSEPHPVAGGGEADDGDVMRIWRECGLPEYFLGNGGTNHKLVAFATKCALLSSPRVEREREMREALRKTRNELYWCAEQLKARGLPGVPGDSVDVALAESAAALSLQVE